MSISDLAEVVGMEGSLPVEDGKLHVPVLIENVKMAYGNILYEVSVIGGRGKKWVNSERVKLE